MEKQYDVIIIGGGPGGIYSAYELKKLAPEKRVAVFEEGHPLEKRRCPIDGEKIKACIRCKTCSIMSGFGGAGAFSDGKYNITNDFGGTLYEHIGKREALELMKYVDSVNMAYGGEGTKLYSTAGTRFKKLCIENKLNLLDASVRHLGTDINYVVLENLFAYLKDSVDFFFDTPVAEVTVEADGYAVHTGRGDYGCDRLIISVGRSGSKWMEGICKKLDIPTHSNRVDLGVRVELPAVVFAHLTDELYESKIVYRTEKFEDNVRTFCMNPNGIVVTENTNGIVTVNGHSYEREDMHTENTNFALLVSKHRPALQHAGRRRHGPAVRGPGPGPQEHREADREGAGDAHPGGHPRGPFPGAAQADFGRDHRDDLRPGQDRAGYRQRRHPALRRGGEVLQHGGGPGRKPHDSVSGPVHHRRRQRHHPQPVPRLRLRGVRGQKDSR